MELCLGKSYTLPMSVRAVTHATLWQIASQFVMAVLSILTVKFVAISLSQELVGNYNSAYSFLQLFGILADFGLYAVAVREMSKAHSKSEMLGVLFVLRMIILCLSLSVAIGFAFLLPKWQGTPLPMGILLASLVPLFTLLAGILRTVFQVTFTMHYVFIAEVLQRVVTVSLIGLAIFLGYRNSDNIGLYHYFLLVGGMGAFILFVLSYAFSAKLIPMKLAWNAKLMKETLRAAMPYGVAFLCIAVYRQLDVTLIALLRPDYEIQNAYYGFVLRMTEVGYLVPTFLLNSVLPLLSDRHANNQDTSSLLSKTLLILLIFGSISTLFTFIWARPLVSLLTTEAYLSTDVRFGSDSALMLLSFPLFLNGLVLMSFYTLLTRHAWKKLVSRMMIGAVVSTVLNLFLIPRFGFIGAAMTSIIVHLLLVFLLWPASQKELPVHLSMRHFVQWLIFTSGLGMTLWLLRPYAVSVPQIIGLGIVTGGIILALLKATNLLQELGLSRVVK